MDNYVHQSEFNQFRMDVTANFDRLFTKFDGFSDRMSERSRTNWSPIISVIGVLAVVVMGAIAGYIGHVNDGHPRMVEEKMKLHVHYIQKQIDEMKANRFTEAEAEDLKRYIDRIDRNGTLYLRESLLEGSDDSINN